MKKISSLALAIALILILLALGITTNVNAVCTENCPTAPPEPEPTATSTSFPYVESWDVGDEFSLDLAGIPGPNSWTQALADGVNVTEPGTICHPFRKGQFGWTGAIYQMVDGEWVELETTFSWVPDEEGVYTACAVAPAAGTYGFFGSYSSK